MASQVPEEKSCFVFVAYAYVARVNQALSNRKRKSSQVFSLCTLVLRLTANLRWLAVACATELATNLCLFKFHLQISYKFHKKRLASCFNTKVLLTCLWDTFSMDYHKKRIMYKKRQTSKSAELATMVLMVSGVITSQRKPNLRWLNCVLVWSGL